MRFSVTVNDSPRHVVHARSSLLAVKATIQALEASQEMPDASSVLTIVVTPLLPLPKPVDGTK